jgi:hypothetical protein
MREVHVSASANAAQTIMLAARGDGHYNTRNEDVLAYTIGSLVLHGDGFDSIEQLVAEAREYCAHYAWLPRTK